MLHLTEEEDELVGKTQHARIAEETLLKLEPVSEEQEEKIVKTQGVAFCCRKEEPTEHAFADSFSLIAQHSKGVSLKQTCTFHFLPQIQGPVNNNSDVRKRRELVREIEWKTSMLAAWELFWK